MNMEIVVVVLKTMYKKTMVGNVSNSKDSYMIEKVIQNDNATIVFWSDRTKTVVKRKDTDEDDVYAAVAQALAKKIYGSTGEFHRMIDENYICQDSNYNRSVLQNSIINDFYKFFDGIWRMSHWPAINNPTPGNNSDS